MFLITDVTLLGRYYKPNETLTRPPLSPPSPIIQTLPQKSSWCCHAKLWPIGCNQEMRQAKPPPSKSRSPLLPRPPSALICSAFMRPMFYSPFLSTYIGPVIFHPDDWLQSSLTAPCLLWLYNIITCLYHRHQYSWPHGELPLQHPVQNRHKHHKQAQTPTNLQHTLHYSI